MKLPIKPEYFGAIKRGGKTTEYRDAHITFVNEETGEQVTRNLSGCRLMMKSELPPELREKYFFTDKVVVAFDLDVA